MKKRPRKADKPKAKKSEKPSQNARKSRIRPSSLSERVKFALLKLLGYKDFDALVAPFHEGGAV
ncbi:MAG: hypothetical protein LBG43_00270 [Treponema sp.]|jgi:hypothetical protein|nr:hypothetical protein [Treponema sp.]